MGFYFFNIQIQPLNLIGKEYHMPSNIPQLPNEKYWPWVWGKLVGSLGLFKKLEASYIDNNHFLPKYLMYIDDKIYVTFFLLWKGMDK